MSAKTARKTTSPDCPVQSEVAAEQARTNLSDFMRRKALEAAEIDVLNYGLVTIPAADWENFEAWVSSPGQDIPALRELAASRPEWQD